MAQPQAWPVQGEIAPISDDALVARLNHQIRLSVGYSDSRLAREREQMQEYYDGARPKPFHRGNSRYVSTDVYDKVESMKAALLDTFTGNRKPVRFAPQGPDDIEKARQATEYCDYVLFRQNRGYETITTVMQDGLLNRAGVAKVWWESRTKQEELELPRPVTEAELDMLLSADEIERFEGDELAPGLYQGVLVVRRPASQVKVDPLPPEEFLISPQAVDIDSAILVAHRVKRTRAELISDGFNKKLVMSLPDEDTFDVETQGERWRRHRATSDQVYRDIDPLQPVLSQITIYESYPRVDIEGKGEPRLWKVTHAGVTLLDKEPVERRPFIPFIPLPRSHAFFGNSFARKIVATQNARSVLTRSIIDHASTTNNPRWAVVKNTLDNPQELMENRLGGIVNVNRPDGVRALEQAGLNPFIFQTLEMLDRNAEKMTGVSEFGQGLDSNVVSKQNSYELIAMMNSISAQRQKIIARNFAEHFLRPLYLEIYQLVLENETEEKVIEVAGAYERIDPRKWQEREDVTVDFALGYGEEQKEVAKLTSIYQMLASDPMVAPMFGPIQRYQMMRRILETAGIKDHQAILMPPEMVPPQGPSPGEMLQMQAAQKQLEIAERQTQVAEGRVENERMNVMQKAQHEREKLAQREADARRRFGLDVDAEQHKQAIDNAELAMVRQVPPVERRAIVSPQS